ncbi:hypothetical protein U9M48_034234 [Paspalum notatum var. saurae]|uniref:phytol kinase n=1 Tax=Paspalum notatum var. saurae TaxID=547442 RepID=A0AAQ3X7B0_PASNO
MAAAAWPGSAYASSPNSLLLSRSPPHVAFALAPSPSPGSSMRKRLLLGVGAPAVAALAAAAPPAVLQDGAVTLLITAGAYSLVRAFDALTERRLIEKAEFEQEDCPCAIRRSVHVILATVQQLDRGTVFCCPCSILELHKASDIWTPLLPDKNFDYLYRELLRGPLYYVLVLLFSVLVFWRDSPIGIISLSMMSGGDGFADIVGRRYGSVKLPFNENKSWVGSISMFISGFLLSAIMLFYFSSLGYIHVSWEEAFGNLALVALAATVVECIPVTEVVDDNISVPLATMLVAFLFFGSSTQ